MSDPLPPLRRLEPDLCQEHAFINPADEIYYLFDYYPGAGRRGGDGNRLILDFKTDINEARLVHWRNRTKQRAIDALANALRAAWPADWGLTTLLVPAPPSGPPDHPDYDARLVLVAKLSGAPYADCVTQTRWFDPSHAGKGRRPSMEDLRASFTVDRRFSRRTPFERLVVFDDVLTTGRHYLALAQALRGAFPKAQIAGLFLVRRVKAPRDEAAKARG